MENIIFFIVADVLKYKKTMDTVLNDIQQECSIQKQSVIDYSNNYLLMKRHLEICEVCIRLFLVLSGILFIDFISFSIKYD